MSDMIGEKKHTWEWRAGYDYATEKYKDEIDSLRARNAELEDALRMIVSGGYEESSRVFAAEVAARAILAKTSSHQPASDQEQQKSG